MVDQGISKLYSVHSMVPKQIKAVKKLENELVLKHPYQQLSCDELLHFIDIIENAALFGKKIGKFFLTSLLTSRPGLEWWHTPVSLNI